MNNNTTMTAALEAFRKTATKHNINAMSNNDVKAYTRVRNSMMLDKNVDTCINTKLSRTINVLSAVK